MAHSSEDLDTDGHEPQSVPFAHVVHGRGTTGTCWLTTGQLASAAPTTPSALVRNISNVTLLLPKLEPIFDDRPVVGVGFLNVAQ